MKHDRHGAGLMRKNAAARQYPPSMYNSIAASEDLAEFREIHSLAIYFLRAHVRLNSSLTLPRLSDLLRL